jgi:hypothetical protein
VAIAPRPLLAMIEEFNPGFNSAADHIRERYRLSGVPEKFATAEATDPHAYTVKLRQATTHWFCRWFLGREGPATEPEFDPEPPRNLYCTPNGSVRYSKQGETIFSLIAKKQAALPPRTAELSGRAQWEAWRREFLPRLAETLHYKAATDPLAPRRLVVTERKGYRVEKFEFLSEPVIYIPTWVFVPDKRSADTRAIFYVSDAGIAGEGSEGMEFGILEKLARKGCLSVAIEPRGTGLTALRSQRLPASWDFRQLFDAETAAAYMAWFMNESLLGMRVLDVVRGIDFALSRDDVSKTVVRAIGVGRGAMWLLFAAALDPRILALVADRGLLSFKTLAASDRYRYGADVFAHGVLQRFDLPQVAACLAGRRLTLFSPLDAMKREVGMPQAENAYSWTRNVFTAARAGGRFEIGKASHEAPADQYLRALEA